MESTAKLFARKMFQLRIHQANGVEFQRLFERIMGFRYSGFRPIAPYGNIGDRKNDGFIPSDGTYFQVYAPVDPQSPRVPLAAAQKAATDFDGLVRYWNDGTPIKKFRFVFNDKYNACPPQIEQAMATIRNTHCVDAGVFLAKDLENEAFNLDDDQLMDIIGTTIPEPDLLPSVDFSVLRDVINHVLREKPPITPESLLQAPNFDDKIKFNGLSPHIAHLLGTGAYQHDAITDYFSKNSTFAKQQLRDQLAGMYVDARNRLIEREVPQTDLGDLVFFDLLQKMVPDDGSCSRSAHARAQEAAIVVMAYYFEACDIFESTDATP